MNTRESISSTLEVASGISVLAVVLAGVFIHVWTIIIAHSASGFWSAVVAFVLPGLSELFWFFRLTSKFGFFNPYSIALLVYVACIFVPVVMGILSSVLKKQN